VPKGTGDDVSEPTPATTSTCQARPHRLRYLLLAFVVAAASFQYVSITLSVGLIALLAYESLYRRNPRIIALVVSGLISFGAFEYFGRYVLKSQMSRFFTADADHRLVPNKAIGINSDGVRCPVEADDFAADTFNIIILGDSFMYGSLLKADQTVPAQVEQVLRQQNPALKARCVNFGWISSSPGPSNRLLRDIGTSYKPDMVVMALDVTDFHDDIWVLGKVGYWDRSPTAYLFARLGLRGVITELYENFRLNVIWRYRSIRERLLPARRFFVVEQPLEKSLPDMVETEENLRRIAAYCKDELKVPFVMVMYPRHFQYSERECPRNWEGYSYTRMGPYSLEPFKWLSALGPRVPFPVHSLLEDFERSTKFPLHFEDDPHWNADGAHVAAEGIVRALEKDKLLPAPPPGG